MITSEEPLNEVLEKIRGYFKELLNSKTELLNDEKVLNNLPSEVGTYIIYDEGEDKPPLYIGETQNLRNRIRDQLFNCNHTLSWRLLKKEIGKSLNLEDLRGLEKRFEKITGRPYKWEDEEVQESWRAVKDFLRKCSFKCIPIKTRGEAKLLERLAQVILNPKIKDYKEED